MTDSLEINLDQDLPLWKRRLGLYDPVYRGLGQPGEDDFGDSPDLESGEDEGESDQQDFDEGEEPESEVEAGQTDEAEDEDEAPVEDEDELLDDGPSLDEILHRPAKINEILDSAGNITREFDSWHEFVTCVANPSLNAWGPSRCASHKEAPFRTKWAGTKSFDEAIRMATLTGWPEGRKLLTEQLVLVRPKMEPYKSIEFAVAGAFPMVPNYCAGDPECMVIDPGADQRNAKPVVRIDYNNYVSADVPPEAIMLRGAAVVSLAESLEARGFSTELRIIGNAQDFRKIWRYSIVYKRAGEILDLDRAAFAIAHPSTMRRLAFALMEQSPSIIDWHVGYGTPINQPNDPESGQPGGSIFIAGASPRETPESANAAVRLAAEKVMGEI
jgi:hypothetical protein